MILLHDSVWPFRSTIYGPGREYQHTVNDFVADLRRQPEWQVLDFPLGDGVTLVRPAALPAPPSRTAQAVQMRAREQRADESLTGRPLPQSP